MPPRLIYLDQNKWIELARAVNGKTDRGVLQILEILRESKRLDLSRFPLSLAHFIETNKRRDIKSRSRLGALMWELSDNWTLAGPKAILRRELDGALSLILNRRLHERSFSLLGKGVVHASDHLEAGIQLDPDRILPEALRLSLETQADAAPKQKCSDWFDSLEGTAQHYTPPRIQIVVVLDPSVRLVA